MNRVNPRINRGNTKINQYKFEVDNSDEDNTDIYQSALMSNLLAFSSKKTTSSSEENKKKPTETRIDFIKSILDNNMLKPMIDFDDTNTEAYVGKRLNKKILDIRGLFSSMNVRLNYVKSGTTGHMFKAISNTNDNVAFAVKVCAYPKDDNYGGIGNLSRPENVELRMLKLLSYFVVNKKTPHYVLPIGTFNTDIKKFVNIPENFINLSDEKNEMYRKFIERYYEGEFEDFVSVLISEWCNGGDLLDYIRKNYKSMSLKCWTIIFFQILFTLAQTHNKYPSFRHNDMKANNILVQITNNGVVNLNESFGYSFENEKIKFIIPNIGITTKIWDFDFACIDGIIDNKKVDSDWTKKINITKRKNRYYDMHYFFNTLISERFFPQFYEGGAPQEIIDFIHRVVPEELRNGSVNVNKKGRIQVDIEYTTPYKVIINDKLFSKYRYNM
ncbi:putative serine/threonine-protein kinase [Cotonvirus japonicus]|uniref:Serine/threonine-protein kinase n=1 Tax=Cotonvirus japonicus TaxID=2811091 RepID=A0ABM7NSN6_9VIRU|nr:putative serine/threonine-protein kinase [Cotonvirus japonicus]BCS83159.1 putative serine/threonine-protein kinase [Cotonvirus japonicus]